MKHITNKKRVFEINSPDLCGQQKTIPNYVQAKKAFSLSAFIKYSRKYMLYTF